MKIVTQILYQKYFMTFQNANMAKIMINAQKRLNGASAEADFWYGDNLDHVEKKAQNSEFHWGPVHGEIGLLK